MPIDDCLRAGLHQPGRRHRLEEVPDVVVMPQGHEIRHREAALRGPPAHGQLVAEEAGDALADAGQAEVLVQGGRQLHVEVVLAYIGYVLGARWNSDPTLRKLFHDFDAVIATVLVAGFAWFVWSRWRERRRSG